MFVFVTAILLFLFSAINAKCPQENIFINKCYHFTGVVSDWLSAEQYCRSVGPKGHLAASSNGFINTFLAGTLNNFYIRIEFISMRRYRIHFLCKTYVNGTTDVWLGGNKLQDGITWTWSDGSKWGFTQWAPGEYTIMLTLS